METDAKCHLEVAYDDRKYRRTRRLCRKIKQIQCSFRYIGELTFQTTLVINAKAESFPRLLFATLLLNELPSEKKTRIPRPPVFHIKLKYVTKLRS